MKEAINGPFNLLTSVLSLVILTLKSPCCHATGPSNININAPESWQRLLEVVFHNSDAKNKTIEYQIEKQRRRGESTEQLSWLSLLTDASSSFLPPPEATPCSFPPPRNVGEENKGDWLPLTIQLLFMPQGEGNPIAQEAGIIQSLLPIKTRNLLILIYDVILKCSISFPSGHV